MATKPTSHPIVDDDTFQKLLRRKDKVIGQLAASARKKKDGRLEAEAVLRRRLLDELQQSFADSHDIKKTVFVSYTRSGQTALSLSLDFAKEFGFHAVTGTPDFKGDTRGSAQKRSKGQRGEPKPGEREYVMETGIRGGIRRNILQNAMFFGIWTPDFEALEIRRSDIRGNEIGGSSGKAPGVWMPFEFGIAFGANKPFVLLIQKGIHPSIYEKALGDEQAIFFEERDLKERVWDAWQLLDAKYQRFIGNRRPSSEL